MLNEIASEIARQDGGRTYCETTYYRSDRTHDPALAAAKLVLGRKPYRIVRRLREEDSSRRW
jgi:hypothetical protein